MKPIINVETGEITVIERPAEEEALWEAHRREIPSADERLDSLKADVEIVKPDRAKATAARARLASLQGVVSAMTALATAWENARSPQAKQTIIETNFGDLINAQATISQALIDVLEVTVKEQLPESPGPGESPIP